MEHMMLRISLIITCLFCLTSSTFGQEEIKLRQIPKDTIAQDTAKDSKVIIENADNTRFVTQGEELIRYLNGNVRLFRDSVFMYCDSAIMIGSQMTAYGNVAIIQNDTINIFADSLIYDGDENMAELFNNVILESNNQQLFTDYLNYDLDQKIGKYTQGALLKNENSEIKSKIGKYFVKSEQVKFYETVTIVNEDFKLWADSLLYDTENDIAYFLGPTRIDQEEAKIYCQDGYYNIRDEIAEFKKQAQYRQNDKTATGDLISYNGQLKRVILAGSANYKELDKFAKADTIVYFEESEDTELIGNAFYKDDSRSVDGIRISYNTKTESFKSMGRSTIVDSTTVLTANTVEFIEESDIGLAYGQVELVDTSSKTTIFSESMFMKQSENYSKAFNPDGTRPLLQTLLDEDSLFLKADTLLSLETPDSITLLHAYYNVRLFKSDLQAKCDSLIYNTTDSTITMYNDPVIWSDSSQFSADTIEIFLKNNQIDRIDLKNKGFIISTSDSIFFNQIKGKMIEVFFVDGNLDSMSVEGNSESIYFMTDDNDAYIGMNKSVCSKMGFKFFDNELKDIFFLVDVNSNLIPIQQVNPDEKLDGFNWQDLLRPKRKEEL